MAEGRRVRIETKRRRRILSANRPDYPIIIRGEC